MHPAAVLLLMCLFAGTVHSKIGDGDRHTIDTEKGTVEIEMDAEEGAVDALPIHAEFPEICAKIDSIWWPVINAKSESNLELKLFHTAGVLARDLERKMEEHKKADHEHFSCHEAKDLLSHTSARETVELFRTLLRVPIQGHTGESIEQTLKDMQKSFNDAKLISPDAYNEFEDVIQDLVKMHRQYDGIKADYDAVMTEHADCKKNFVNFIKETLDLTHDDIPKWDQLQFGLDSLREQCKPQPAEL